MIAVNELRKGNLLNRNLKMVYPQTTLPDEIVEVFKILEDKIAYVYPNIENRVEPFEDDVAQMGNGLIPFAELEPLLLTEKLLIKAGCTISDESVSINYGNDAHLQFHWDGKQLQHLSETPVQAITSSVALTSLHQLQNLYADVTGHSLEIVN